MFNHIFEKIPGQQFSLYIPFIVLIAALFTGSIIFSYIYKNRKKTDFAFKRIFKKLSRDLAGFAILYTFLLLVRYENIPYFSMRFWLYLTTLLLVFQAYRYIKKWKVDYPRENENISLKRHANIRKKQETKQYLPNKKRK